MHTRIPFSGAFLLFVFQLSGTSSQLLGGTVGNVLGTNGQNQPQKPQVPPPAPPPVPPQPTQVQPSVPSVQQSNVTNQQSPNTPSNPSLASNDTSSLVRSLGEGPSYRKDPSNKKVQLGSPLYKAKEDEEDTTGSPTSEETPKRKKKAKKSKKESSSSTSSSIETLPDDKESLSMKKVREKNDAKKLKVIKLIKKLKLDSSSELESTSVEKEIIQALIKKRNKAKAKRNKRKRGRNSKKSKVSELTSAEKVAKFSDAVNYYANITNSEERLLSLTTAAPAIGGRSILELDSEVEPVRPKKATTPSPQPIETEVEEIPDSEEEDSFEKTDFLKDSESLESSLFQKTAKIIIKGGKDGKPSVVIVPQNIYDVRYKIYRGGNKQKTSYSNNFAGIDGKLTPGEAKAIKGLVQNPNQNTRDNVDTILRKRRVSSTSGSGESGSGERIIEGRVKVNGRTVPKFKISSKGKKKKKKAKRFESDNNEPGEKVSDIFKKAEEKAKAKFAKEEAEAAAKNKPKGRSFSGGLRKPKQKRPKKSKKSEDDEES